MTTANSATIDVAEGCQFRVELVDAGGAILAYNDDWAIPPGSPTTVALPF